MSDSQYTGGIASANAVTVAVRVICIAKNQNTYNGSTSRLSDNHDFVRRKNPWEKNEETDFERGREKPFETRLTNESKAPIIERSTRGQ